ncbi:MAG TPA: hypothetical protein GXZ95_04160 [Mollicutes bacterium]|nr:hypothetical protein [Mollicutes bacterium]
MSLRQIHVLDKIVKKQHKKVKREFKILEMKKTFNNKCLMVIEAIVDTYHDIVNRFTYENKNLAYAKRK